MQLDTLKVTDVTPVSSEQSGNVITVHTELTMEDGSTVSGKHVFPADTLEWRAAEYDLDPTDLDTLLDIVLYEPFLEEPDQPELTLHDAPSVEEARAYHLQRVEKVKKKATKARRGGVDPVREQIKASAAMQPEAIGLKKAFIGKMREARRSENAMRQLPDPERLGMLRRALDPPTTREGEKEKDNG